ncbi:hypothetical protein LZ30DRAFT_588193 [Colletotrichum cereale]|nr:hypothetical protein LZ30DRAFT_588193 [Colletotrichum cereale]
MENKNLQPIAIVGINLKFPGDAISADSFWKMLEEKRSAVGVVPPDRFNVAAFYHPDPARLDSIRTQHGHFMKEDPRAFDAPFFTMSQSEASILDIQQRGLLEGAYHTFENAGISMSSLAGSNTSVYVASFGRDADAIHILRDSEYLTRYTTTASGSSMLSNRISHFFDLRGPSLSLDTACSSGLYAFHLACQSLWTGESRMSLVAGSNTYSTPECLSIPLTNAGFLSPDGISYSFDHRANGYGRGEGFAFALLKPLDQALQDGDMIRAVVRATGVNQDGRTPSITQPSCAAQQKLIRDTYAAGGLDLATTGFVEAHGTGTLVGDPIEASAIGEVFRDHREESNKLYIGSVKSNIGHLEGASGLAGVLKAVLMLERGVIVPNVWTEKVNPKIDTESLRIQFPAVPTPWPTKGLRRVSVSSFGYGGSNAHVVLDDASNYLRSRKLEGIHMSLNLDEFSSNGSESGTHITNGCVRVDELLGTTNPDTKELHKSIRGILVLTGADEEAPKRQAEALQEYLSSHANHNYQHRKGGYFSDLLHTLFARRTHHPWRSYAVCSSVQGIATELCNTLSETVRATAPSVKFVFTGQGAQWARMGLELCQYPVFRKSLEHCEAHLRSLGCTWSLLEELGRPEESSKIHEPALSQPICTALQVALVELYNDWAITPSAVSGHSSGEIAAAFAAGFISRETAWKIAFHRGTVAELLLRLPETDNMAMMSVGLSEKDVTPYLAGPDAVAYGLSVGCVNSPKNVTLTGDETTIDKLFQFLEKKHIFARKLAVTIAYHSKYMNAVADEYERLIRDIEPGPLAKQNDLQVPKEKIKPLIPMYSSVTGNRCSAREVCDPLYWVRNLTSPVRFSDALASMVAESDAGIGSRSRRQASLYIVEIGPQAALRRPIEDTLVTGELKLRKDTWLYNPALRARLSDVDAVLDNVGQLWAHGVSVDIGKVNMSTEKEAVSRPPRMVTDLPSYRFSRAKLYWDESRISRNFSFRPFRRHQLLGVREKDWNPNEPRWRHFIRVQENPWVLDHGLSGSPIYPGSGMVVMAIEAARQLSARVEHQVTGYRLRNIRFIRAINIDPSERGVEAQIIMRPRRLATNSTGQMWYDWRIYSIDGEDWVECAYGSIKVEMKADASTSSHTLCQRESDYVRAEFHKTADQCTQRVNHEQLYGNMNKMGFAYGPYFSQLRQVSYSSSGHAAATTVLRGYTNKMPYAAEDPCVIHPTTLDALLHLQTVALSLGGWKQIPTMMLSQISEVWISQKLLTASDMTLLTASTHETMRGFREAEFSTVALLADTLEPVVRVEGERGTSITNLALSANGSIINDPDGKSDSLCYSISFLPDLSLMGPQEIKAYIASQFPQPEISRKAMIARADSIALYYAEKTLKRLETEGVVDFPSDKTYLKRYLSCLQRLVSQERSCTLQSRGLGHLEIEDVIEQASFEPTQRLTARVGEHLYDILTNKTNPLQVVYDDNAADQFYHSEIFSINSDKVGMYIHLLAQKNPQLRILEVGAGTGSSASHILSFLKHDFGNGRTGLLFSEYTYTDASAGFFEKASQQFIKYASNMRFRKLDLEVDPLEQGFETESYDVVVAGNVLHATSDVARSLTHVRKLLRPGGKLIMDEIVNFNDVRDYFIFGVLPGWWLRPAPEGHLDQGAIHSENQWNDLLSQTGFGGLDFSLRDIDEEPYHRLSVMVATAEEVDEKQLDTHTSSLSSTCYVVLDRASASQGEVASGIHRNFSQALAVSPEELSSCSVAGSNVVCLLDLESQFLPKVSMNQFEAVKHMAVSAGNVIWVNSGGGPESTVPEAEIAIGLSRSVCSERIDQGFKVLSLQNKHDIQANVDMICRLLKQIDKEDDRNSDSEYAQRKEVAHAPRLVPLARLNEAVTAATRPRELATYTTGDTQKPHINTTIATPGLLDTLYFVENNGGATSLHDGEIEIEIKASSVNFKDVMHALGQIPGVGFGFDGSGVISRTCPNSAFSVRDPVMWCNHTGGGFGTYLRCSELQAEKMPKGMSFNTAAALPAVYNTAIYALMHVARLEKGESVLIHAAAGGVGQAAIQLARIIGAKVYATVGNKLKRELLKETYNLTDDCIFDSRSPSFEKEIKLATNGRGVDVVLNSLGGDLLEHSWDCIATFGRFVEIGKADIINNTSLPMLPFGRNVTFSAVDAVVLHQENKPLVKKILKELVNLWVKHPEMHEPKPLHVFPAAKLEDAMRFLQGGKNTGKAIIDYATPGQPLQYQPMERPGLIFDKDATYIISGGLGGLGRRIVRWMVGRGARNLVLLSRRGAAASPEAESFVSDVEATENVRIWAPCCDATDKQVLLQVLEETGRRFPPIKGCIQCAMVLHDSLFQNMSADVFHEALKPKVVGSWNLHELLPADLDFFVLLSSFGGIVGQRGQSNYAAGNAYEDALARHRVSRGLKAVSIDLPLVAEGGWATDNYDAVMASIKVNLALGLEQLMALLQIVCDRTYDCTAPGSSQVVTIVDSPQRLVGLLREGHCQWMAKPLFSLIRQMGEAAQDQGGQADDGKAANTVVDYLALSRAAASVDGAAEIILQGLLLKLSKALATPMENLDAEKPAFASGVDSLIAVEIRSWFIKTFGVEVTVFIILKDQSLLDLCRSVAAKVLGSLGD